MVSGLLNPLLGSGSCVLGSTNLVQLNGEISEPFSQVLPFDCVPSQIFRT